MARDVYVDKSTGNDGFSGLTEGTPKRTLNGANAIAIPGDTIWVKNSTYGERLNFNAGGTSGNYIVWRAYPGHKPVIDGTGLGNGVMVEGNNKSYIKFLGFHITNHTGSGIEFTCGIISGGVGIHYIEIRDNEISNQAHQTIIGHAILIEGLAGWVSCTFPPCSNIIIDNNYIHDVSTGVPDSYNECVTLAWDIEHFQVTNNVIENTDFIGYDLIGIGAAQTWGAAPYVAHGDVNPHYGVVRGNAIRNSGLRSGPDSGARTAYYVDGAHDVLIERNYAYRQGGPGCTQGNEGSNYNSKDILVRHNVFHECFRGVAVGSTGIVSSSQRPRIVHNTLYTDGAFHNRSISIWRSDNARVLNNISAIDHNPPEDARHIEHFHPATLGDTPELDGNLYNKELPGTIYFEYQNSFYTTLAALQAGKSQDLNGAVGDPLFTNIGAEDFTPLAGSPAINGGVALATATAAGSGTTIPVSDPYVFYDGFGIPGEVGDLIQVGLAQTARIVSINRGAQTLLVDVPLTWALNDPINYPFGGIAPDMGAIQVGVLVGENVPPINTVPGAQAVAKDTVLEISGISAVDPDGDLSTVRLNVDHGTVTVTLSGAAVISAGVNGSATLTISGTETDINASLEPVSYQGDPGFTGMDGVTVTSTDATAREDVDFVSITVTGSSQPINTVPGAQNASVGVPLVFNETNSNAISIADADAGTNPLRVTLTGTKGTITLSGTTGLAFLVGDGAADIVMTFQGQLAAINAALESLSFIGTLTGAGSLQIYTDDLTTTALNEEPTLRAWLTFDSPGTLGLDSSPAALNAATVTGAITHNDATRGDVLELDGIDDQAEIPGLISSPLDITIMAWVKVESGAINQEVISLGDHVGLRVEGGAGAGVTGFFYTGSGYLTLTSGVLIGGSGWRHVAYVIDHAANTHIVYVDGAVVASSPGIAPIEYSGLGQSTMIGRHGFLASNWLDGLIDHVRIFNRALSLTAMRTLALELPDTDDDTVTITVGGSGIPPVNLYSSPQTATNSEPLNLNLGVFDEVNALVSVKLLAENGTWETDLIPGAEIH